MSEDVRKEVAEEPQEKLFTQEQVNKIVQERLARERSKKPEGTAPIEPEPAVENREVSTEETRDTAAHKEPEDMEIQPEIIQGSYSALEVPEDIAKYREFFGREHDADDRYITAYKDWKAYAEYYGTEIQPVDETELAQWRARVFAEHPERYRNVDGSPYVPPGKRKEGASSNKIDALMRRIFGLSEK